MTKIRILHLSDIHFGQERKDGSIHFQDDIRDALTRDCARMKAQLGSANAVVVTGDIAFGGAKPEYDKAGVWLDSLCDTVGCLRNAVHTIPGNHDVDRKKIDYTVELMHEKLRECGPDDVDEIVAKILGDTDNKTVSVGAAALFDKLAAYREFAARYESDFESEAKPISVKNVFFPSGHALRFFGMTSVQVCDGNDQREKMILGSNQYIFKPEENVEYVVMCHHPFTWFKDEARAMPTVRTRGRVMLAGHEHNARFRRIEEGGCEYIMLDAGAANPPKSEQRSPHCYNWIEFDLLNNDGVFHLRVEVFPRVWIASRADFGADSNRIGGGNSEAYTVRCPNYARIAETDAKPGEDNLLVPRRIHDEEVATMSDEERFAKLLYFFWRYLDWRERYGVLAKVEVLPKGLDKPMPQVVERNALSTARAQHKLAAVWDEVMTFVPADQREQNPF